MLLSTRCLAIGPTVHMTDVNSGVQEQLTVCVAEKDHADNGHMWMLIEEVTLELVPFVDTDSSVEIVAVLYGLGDDGA